jgi:hypothetical protein
MIPPLVSEASSSIKLSANLGGKRSESDERDGIFCGTHGMELGIGLPPEPNGPVPHQAGVLFLLLRGHRARRFGAFSLFYCTIGVVLFQYAWSTWES